MFNIKKQLDYRHISVNNLKFVVIDLNFVADEIKATKEYEDLKNRDYTNKLVRCNIKISFENVSKIDTEYLKECFKDAYDCNEIMPIIVNDNHVRNDEIQADISDQEAIEKFLEASNRGDKKQLIELIEKELMTNEA